MPFDRCDALHKLTLQQGKKGKAQSAKIDHIDAQLATSLVRRLDKHKIIISKRDPGAFTHVTRQKPHCSHMSI